VSAPKAISPRRRPERLAKAPTSGDTLALRGHDLIAATRSS
jgi:hypothetical protein